MNGYTGKILKLDLGRQETSTIPTARYEEWVGGHGIGSALFFDLVEDKTIDGFDPRNVVTIMTSPLTGSMAPGGSSRTEIQGIGVQTYPIGWFTRSNLGGRFGPMLKFAGWDGLVIVGKADKPIWIDIRNDQIHFREADPLWGLDTWETQKRIWKYVLGSDQFDDWFELGDTADSGRTTQRPAVMAIAPTGEKLSRVAAIIHDAGNAAGQGGFGAVWGSKNLKAISVIGTGSVAVADPAALLETRAWLKKNYLFNINNPAKIDNEHQLFGDVTARTTSSAGSSPVPVTFWQRRKKSRPQACLGCPAGCRSRHDIGLGNESQCVESLYYSYPDLKQNSQLWVKAACAVLESFLGEEVAFLFALLQGENSKAVYAAGDLCQKLAINAYELQRGIPYLRALHKKGVLGRGKAIETKLDFEAFGTIAFAEQLVQMIAQREDIGDALADGIFRAAQKWGRLEEDLASGLLLCPYWGLPEHYDPRFQVEWGYGSIMGDRDINEHDFNILFWIATIAKVQGKDPPVTAEEAATIYSEKMVPFEGDPRMLDYSEDNIYSMRFAKLVAWHRYYTRFWKQSVLFCDFLFPDFLNLLSEDKRGMLGEGEARLFAAVTGKQMSLVDGIALGRKIWNLDNAIWVLQGRHRDMIRFSKYIYDVPTDTSCYMPGIEDGKWVYLDMGGRRMDDARFEEWKTKFYTLEGWDVASGWPTRAALEARGLKHVADELEAKGRLGKA
jgi:aldehyde:ferredoxin oxidoreductase